jgi:ribosome maturation protein SDO1
MARRPLFVCCAVGLLYLSALSVAAVPLTMLDAQSYPLARCMDGSPGGFYLEKAARTGPDVDDAATSWVIELEGGGECASQRLCDSRRGTHLASSKYFPDETTLGFLASGNPDHNPRLSKWNRVHVPYCSQDLWMGTRTTDSPGDDPEFNGTFGYFFAGHHILDAVLTELEASHGLGDATNIVLTGESAGGIGVWPNLDWLSQRFPAARVVGAPIAGFYFFAYPYQGPGHTSSGLADFRESAWPLHFALWGSFVDEDCRHALGDGAYACSLANYSFPFITSETFIVESQTDKVVLEYHDWVPSSQDPNWSQDVREYLSSWQANMTQALVPAMDAKNKNNGVFNPACFIHTSFNANGPLIGNVSYYSAFDAWFYGENAELWKLQDECGILCNPTCPH